MYGSYSAYNTIAAGTIIGYLIGAVVIQIILGVATKHINESKGYSGGFAWGFWLGIIGIIVVACKADNRSYESNSYEPSRYSSSGSSYSSSGYIATNTWKCVCGQENSENLNYCTRCRRTKNEAEIELAQTQKIPCPHCGAMNKPSNNTCFACGRPMYETENTLYEDTSSETKNSDESPSSEAVNMLKQLSNLHDQGILTDQEFESKKAEVLSRI